MERGEKPFVGESIEDSFQFADYWREWLIRTEYCNIRETHREAKPFLVVGAVGVWITPAALFYLVHIVWP